MKRFLSLLIALGVSFSGPPVFAGDALRPEVHASGLEEKLNLLWPSTQPLVLKNLEPVLVFRAEGGFGDIAYLLKIVDGFNARGIQPVVAVVGGGDSQQAALQKLNALRADLPADLVLWTEKDGRLVDSSEQPVAGNRPLRPVLIQHFSQVNPAWARQTAEDFVPRLFKPLYQQPRFLLIGYNAPGNQFGGYLLPGDGEFLNLYLTPPAPAGPQEPNAIYTGHLFDRQLQKLAREFDALRQDRPARRRAGLSGVSAAVPGIEPLSREILEAADWATLYTSQGGSRAQLEALVEAFARVNADRKTVFFTFFGNNPKLWYYPADYWQPHADLVDFLKKDPRVRFTDLTARFGSSENAEAPVTVVNLPPLPMGAMRALTAASDLALAPGHNTLMEVMGLAAAGVGPDVVLTFPVFRAERDNLQQTLRMIPQRNGTLQDILGFDQLRETPERLPEVTDRLTALLASSERRSLFRQDIGKLADVAFRRSARLADGNLGNRLMEILARADQEVSVVDLLEGPVSYAAEIQAFQRRAEEKFRAGLEEDDEQKVLKALADAGVEGNLKSQGWDSLQGRFGFERRTFLINTEQVVSLPSTLRLFVEGGLPPPENLPKRNRVINVDEPPGIPGLQDYFTEGLARAGEKPLARPDGVVLNANRRADSDQLLGSIPLELLSDPGRRPGVIRLREHEMEALRNQHSNLFALFEIARQEGPLLDEEISWIEVRGRVYLLIQA